jgi:phosphopantetheinyl transferase
LALYAFTYERAVGVDVEVVRRPSNEGAIPIEVEGVGRPVNKHARRPLNEIAIARRAFGLERARRLEGLPPAIREREFLRAWVRHEAILKCRGTGIGARRSDRSREQADQSTEDLWVAALPIGSRAAAAVALVGAPLEVCCWEWQPHSRSLARYRD